MKRRAWSLADELATLAHAVDAARGVADAASVSADSMQNPAVTTATIAGSLALVAVRLRDLGQVVRGELDPGRLRASHNAMEVEATNDGDVIFRAWGPNRRAIHARRELARAEQAIARVQR